MLQLQPQVQADPGQLSPQEQLVFAHPEAQRLKFSDVVFMTVCLIDLHHKSTPGGRAGFYRKAGKCYIIL
ncbi:MAG TPA: hypothetical protein VGD92_04390 [Sphingobacteriaceae bacterium]